MLAQRLITAAVGLPIILGLILLGGAVYTVAAAVILALGALEFFAATDPEDMGTALTAAARPRLQQTVRPFYRQRPPGYAGAAAVALMVAAADRGFDEWTGALALAVATVFLLAILRGDPQAGLRDWIWIIAGVAYIGFLGSHLVLVRDLDDDGDWALLAVFATFATDTCSYFVGRAIGRVHIAGAISPGKTMEGYAAGLAGGFAAVLLLNRVTGLDASAGQIIPLALLLPPVAMIGDLAESLVKRGAGIKDTGELLPGHGGFLDRMDSVLFTAPLVYYFVLWAIL